MDSPSYLCVMPALNMPLGAGIGVAMYPDHGQSDERAYRHCR